MTKLISLDAWAKLHNVPLNHAKKLAKEEKLEGAVANISGRGRSYSVPENTLLPKTELVYCHECNCGFQQITVRHLQLHGLTIQEYKIQYPNAELITPSVRERIKKAKIGSSHSEQTREKISQKNSGKIPWNFGQPHSDETKTKISKKTKGKKISDAHKDAISKGGIGKKHSIITREKMSATQKNMSNDEKVRREQAKKKTSLSKYGVDNPAKNLEIKQKTKRTIMERYGNWHTSIDEVKQKIRDTNENKYGCHPSKTETVKQKVIETNLRKYGETNSTRIARAAFREQTGFSNPFDMEIYQQKAIETMLVKYGVRKPLQNEEIRNKLRKYYNDEYNRPWSNQQNIPQDAFDILSDKTTLEELLLSYSVKELANKLNINYDLILKYCGKYNIPLPKSSYETAIISFLSLIGVNFETGNRTFLENGKEIDFLLHDHQLGIELCGLYYHSEFGMNKMGRQYHLDKTKIMATKKYKLLTIFEDEWVFKNALVKNRILNILNQNERGPGARKLLIKKISASESKIFLDQYHMQGAGPPGFVNYGAFHDNNLIAVMNFCRPRKALGRTEGYDELLRYATNGKTYAGIASKLFKTFVREYDPAGVISYADRRWSCGELYHKLGFELDGSSEPSYSYFKKGTISRRYRYHFQHARIKHLVEDGENKSETQIMLELGYDRIWDCGTFRFIWTRKMP